MRGRPDLLSLLRRLWRSQVLVTSERGEKEVMDLKETAEDSAVFEGFLTIVFSDRFGVSNDGFLHGIPGDSIDMQYQELRPLQLVQRTMHLGFAATLAFRQPNIPPGFPLHVTLVDGDLNQNVEVPDVVDTNVYLLSTRGVSLIPRLLTLNASAM